MTLLVKKKKKKVNKWIHEKFERNFRKKKHEIFFSHTQKYFFFPENLSSPCFSDEKKDLKKDYYFYFLNVIIN